MNRTIKQGDLLIVRGKKAEGLTARGRMMRVPYTQVVEFLPPNRYHNLVLTHIAGPLKGLTIQFSVALARKANTKPVCLCSAYDWPHRTGAGKCQETR